MGCVIWTKKLLQMIETFQNHIMRFMTNHKLIDHVKIEVLLKTIYLTPIMSTIKSKVLKLFGTSNALKWVFQTFVWKALLKEKGTKEDQRNDSEITS